MGINLTAGLRYYSGRKFVMHIANRIKKGAFDWIDHCILYKEDTEFSGETSWISAA